MFWDLKLPSEEGDKVIKVFSDKDYEHALIVFNLIEKFNYKNLLDYHNLYLKTDVLLLADVFGNFRRVCLKNYGLDSAWYYTSPGLASDAALMKTKIYLDLLKDIDMLLMFEEGIRGGVSMISKTTFKSNE